MTKQNQSYSELRIIGGQWRGRKLRFPCVTDLRPTPDRVRETLFNWLAPIIHGARCLDLFAGSGALGFEALSRGAKEVVFIDQSPIIVKELSHNAHKLNASNAIIKQEKISADLSLVMQPFDIVFLDPPFQQNLLSMSFHWLEKRHLLLSSSTLLYIETDKQLSQLILPETWQLLHEKRAGQVYYYLIRYVA